MRTDLSELASRQFALFTAGQARAHGLSRSTLYREVERGRLRIVQPSVFAVAGAPATWEQRLLAALLSAGPDAVASHRAAARIWQLACVGEDHVEVSVPRRSGARPTATIVHRSADLAPSHSIKMGAFRVTNPLRTLVDLGAVLPRPCVEDALDRGLTRRLYSVSAVEWMLHQVARQGRSGCGVLGGILDDRALGAEVADSVLEPRMARLFKTYALPPAVFHNTPRQMSKDFVRQNGLAPYLWHILRFTWEQVVRQPRMVAGTIRQTLDALAARNLGMDVPRS